MLKIAICDDNKSDAAKIETALSQIRTTPLDYDVFYHAGELLRYLSVQEEGYHLYIFDIEMPGMSGLKLAEEVRKRDAKYAATTSSTSARKDAVRRSIRRRKPTART